MRIDNENKIVVPDFVAEWFESISENELIGNDVFRIIQDVLKVGEGLSTWNDYDVDETLVNWVEKNEETFLRLIVNCNKGIGYTVELTKYYWRKKKEHLVWFEDETNCYLNKTRIGELRLSTIAEFGDWEIKFTEQEARDLLKNDFYMFEPVEF